MKIYIITKGDYCSSDDDIIIGVAESEEQVRAMIEESIARTYEDGGYPLFDSLEEAWKSGEYLIRAWNGLNCLFYMKGSTCFNEEGGYFTQEAETGKRIKRSWEK